MITKIVYEWDCKTPINGADAEMMFRINDGLINHIGDIFLVKDIKTNSIFNVEIGDKVKKRLNLDKDLSLKETMIEYCKFKGDCCMREDINKGFTGDIQLDVKYCRKCGELLNLNSDTCKCGCVEFHDITRLTGFINLNEMYTERR